jgi:hypothetical protein
MPANIIFENEKVLSQIGFVYDVSAQTGAVEGDITFDTNGFLTSGISHSIGASHINFTISGKYLISFTVSSALTNQFAIFKNNSLVAGGIYGTGVANVQTIGQAVVTISAGDFITNRNHTSLLPVVLGTSVGGTQTNVNASVVILKLQ